MDIEKFCDEKFYDSEFAEHDAVLKTVEISVRQPFERTAPVSVHSSMRLES